MVYVNDQVIPLKTSILHVEHIFHVRTSNVYGRTIFAIFKDEECVNGFFSLERFGKMYCFSCFDSFLVMYFYLFIYFPSFFVTSQGNIILDIQFLYGSIFMCLIFKKTFRVLLQEKYLRLSRNVNISDRSAASYGS